MGRISDGGLSHVYTGGLELGNPCMGEVQDGNIIAIGSNRRPPEPYSLPRSYKDPSEVEFKSWLPQAIANL